MNIILFLYSLRLLVDSAIVVYVIMKVYTKMKQWFRISLWASCYQMLPSLVNLLFCILLLSYTWICSSWSSLRVRFMLKVYTGLQWRNERIQNIVELGKCLSLSQVLNLPGTDHLVYFYLIEKRKNKDKYQGIIIIIEESALIKHISEGMGLKILEI